MPSQQHCTQLITFSSLIDFILLSVRMSHCFFLKLNGCLLSISLVESSFPQPLTIGMFEGSILILLFSLFYAYILEEHMQSYGIKCNLYANNFLIYIFILNLTFKLQSHISRCHLISIKAYSPSTVIQGLGFQHTNFGEAQLSPKQAGDDLKYF